MQKMRSSSPARQGGWREPCGQPFRGGLATSGQACSDGVCRIWPYEPGSWLHFMLSPGCLLCSFTLSLP